MLTPIQRRFLRKYRTFRSHPFTVSGQVVWMLVRFIILSMLVEIAWMFVSKELALFTGGMSLGGLIFQASMSWQAQRVLPGLVEVIDWDKVDRLLGDTEPA